MANKVILKDSKNNEILPITRGELVLDSSGNPALHSSLFLATDSLPGLIGSSLVFKPTSISLTKEWKSTGFILNPDNGFISGLHLIKILVGNLIFSGIASVFVGEVITDDEIVLHMCGKPQTYKDGTQGRIYAKIAPNNESGYGEIWLATSVPETSITNLSITMKKLL